ncbi:MAG TPA: alanine racemase, partial [Candidatus Saccharimonadales bacterium]|nr:alanine racemase [Candidatus Saccharimonadales bacterium]
MYGLRRHNSLDVYNRIEISKNALLHNAGYFRRISGLEVMPVIKSNAYGHGITIVVEALKSGHFPLLAVDGYFEAGKIRRITDKPILVMGMLKPGDYKKIKTKNIEFVVHDKEGIKAIGALGKNIKVHLDINTGMNRYGINPAELDDYLDLISRYPKIRLGGVMTHLADPDSNNEKHIVQAVRDFDRCVGK